MLRIEHVQVAKPVVSWLEGKKSCLCHFVTASDIRNKYRLMSQSRRASQESNESIGFWVYKNKYHSQIKEE